ncbi:MAG TPA: exodeoxyribonuclease VII small subunit [Thermoanaerobaculia bacterium]|nr:exodeoxyribonuclease VII small subunit [Thermoanaerobaculia bacterium]
MTARVRKERSFEEALARLEEIVAEIESEDLGLERQFELFQKAWRSRASATASSPRCRSRSRSC